MIIQECITLAGHRDPGGVPQPDPKKFPHGIKGLCDYIHSKGLLCGIYTDVGPKTCAGWEGSYNHEQVDAKTYAECERRSLLTPCCANSEWRHGRNILTVQGCWCRGH